VDDLRGYSLGRGIGMEDLLADHIATAASGSGTGPHRLHHRFVPGLRHGSRDDERAAGQFVPGDPALYLAASLPAHGLRLRGRHVSRPVRDARRNRLGSESVPARWRVRLGLRRIVHVATVIQTGTTADTSAAPRPPSSRKRRFSRGRLLAWAFLWLA